MATIKSYSDFLNSAPWFCLENYKKEYSNFDQEAWTKEIAVRAGELARSRIYLGMNQDLAEKQDAPPKLKEEIERTLVAITSLITSKTIRAQHLSEGGHGLKFGESRRVVSPAKLSDLRLIYQKIPKGFCSFNIDSLRQTELPILTSAYIRVDLTVPDNVLIEEFKTLLKEYREGDPDILAKGLPNPKSTHSESTLQKVRQYQVLPYLDLERWGELTGNHITAPVLARVLFPNGEKGERFVTDTLKDLAHSVIKPFYLEMMLHYTEDLSDYAFSSELSEND